MFTSKKHTRKNLELIECARSSNIYYKAMVVAKVLGKEIVDDSGKKQNLLKKYFYGGEIPKELPHMTGAATLRIKGRYLNVLFEDNSAYHGQAADTLDILAGRVAIYLGEEGHRKGKNLFDAKIHFNNPNIVDIQNYVPMNSFLENVFGSNWERSLNILYAVANNRELHKKS
jgi:hypothetical protein